MANQVHGRRCQALATGNANLLPVLPELVFYPKPDLCPDCEGTGYTWMGDEFTLCYCMADHLPAYDFPRIIKGEVIATIGMSRRSRNSEADVWVPCQHCDIGAIKHGPYNLYFRDDVIRVPWVPDCTTCNRHRSGRIYRPRDSSALLSRGWLLVPSA